MRKFSGFWGIWYWNQRSHDEYVFKYSGGLGTYCADHIPMAIYSPETQRTYFCYGGRTRLRNRLVHMVSFYDHSTQQVCQPTMIVDKKTDDAHDNPVLSIDKDGYIWVFSSSHGLSRPSFIWKSHKPHDIDDFVLIQETNFSYPQPWYLDGLGFIFLHTKYINHNRCLMWSTSKDGMLWSEEKQLSFIEKGHYQVSWPWHQKIGTAFNYHPDPGGLNYRTNVYYMETSDFGQTWQNAQGDSLKTPLKEIQNPALVCDYAAQGLKVYIMDMNYDLLGHPIIIFIVSKGYESGPKNDPRIWTTAHWTGKRWDIHGSISSDSNYDTGCLHVINDSHWRIMGPIGKGPQPYNPGGEVEVWDSLDRGISWQKIRQLTCNSAYNHTFIRKPFNASPEFAAFWADGNPRKKSDSRFYISDLAGDNVYQLPVKMSSPLENPKKIQIDGKK
jgi:hypothetical protein